MTSTAAVLGIGGRVVFQAKRMLFSVVSILVCDRNSAKANWLLHHAWHIFKQSAVISLQSVQNLRLSEPSLAGGIELGPCKALLLRSHDCMQHQILLDTTVPPSVCCAGGAPATYQRCYRKRQSRPAAQLRAPASGLPGLPVRARARAQAQPVRRLPDWRPHSRHTGAAPYSAVPVKPLSLALMQRSVCRLGAGRACHRCLA